MNYIEDWIHKGLLEKVCKTPTLRTLVLDYNCILFSAHCAQLVVYWDDRSPWRLFTTNDATAGPESGGQLTHQSARWWQSPFFSWGSVSRSSYLLTELWRNTTRLTQLYLNDNRIAKLDRCCFVKLVNLKILDLSSNLLWTHGDTFDKGPQSLEFLDLS